MQDESGKNSNNITKHMAQIVSAYVSRNDVSQEELVGLITRVGDALTKFSSGNTESSTIEAQKPAVSVNKSIGQEFLICLEDGKKFKSLKRHLRTHYNLTPDEYRQKWNLPEDYPMVAPAYALARSNLAKEMRLGHTSKSRKRA